MKQKAQLTVAALFVLAFIKSFMYKSNSFDVVFIILCSIIYLAYEYIQDRKVLERIEEVKKETEDRLEVIKKEQEQTKHYVSSISTSVGFRR